MYAGNGQTLGAHDDLDYVDGDSSGGEVNLGEYYSFGANGVLRYTGND